MAGATSTGPVPADRVVIAAGVPSAALLRDLGVRVPLLSGKGYSVTARGTGTGPVHPMKLLEANVACSPFDDGVRLSGMFELGGRGEGVRSRALERIHQAVAPRATCGTGGQPRSGCGSPASARPRRTACR